MIDRMDDTELSISFRQAKDKRDQIGVLSDLTMTSPQEIAERLDKLGLLEGTGLRPEQFSNHYIAVEPAYGRRRPYKPRGAKSVQIDLERGRAMFEDGATDEEIAEAFGVRPYRVAEWRSQNGLSRTRGGDRTKGGFLPPIDELRAMDLYREGYDDLAMSEALGVTVRRVQNWRLRMGLKRVKGHSKKTKGEEAIKKEKEIVPEIAVPTIDAAEALRALSSTPVLPSGEPEQPLMEVRQFLATLSEMMTPGVAKGGLILNGEPVRDISSVHISMVDGALCVEIRTEG